MGNIPNWPVLVTQWGAPFGANGGAPATQNVDLSNRVLNSIGFKTGKQYELDSAQAGELTVSLRNNDAVLDPVNASSPFAGHIAPYQPFSVQAMYPPSVNILTSAQARNGQGWPLGAIPSSFDIYTGTDPNGTGTIVTQAGATGGCAFNFAVPATYGAGQFICAFLGTAAEPGQEYGFSTNVMNTTAGVNGPVQLAFGWFGPNYAAGPASWSYGPVVNLTPNTWYNIGATANAPANACGLAVGIVTGGTPSAAYNVEMYSSQFQYDNVSAYADPGLWYPMFTGFVERWPSKWNSAGQYGTIAATVVDAMALLSQGQLDDPLTEEIEYAGASWCYPLGDPSTSSQGAEANGLFPPVTTESTTINAGTLTFGNDVSAANMTTGIFTAGGVDPTVVTITPDGAAGGNSVVGTSYLSLDSAGIAGPQTNTFTRMIAFCCTDTSAKTSAYTSFLWSTYDSNAGGLGNQLTMGFSMTGPNTGEVFGGFNGGVSAVYSPSAGWTPADGNWHLLTFGYNNSTGQVTLSVDGSATSFTSGAGINPTAFGFVKDSIGGNIWPGNQGTGQFEGSIAYAAEFPSLLSSTQIANLYSAWYDACSGESATARYNRVLRYAKYSGPTAVGAGVLTTDMGPATDMAGTDALTCLENIVQSENGNHYVSSNGTLTFTGRGFRYNRPTPTYIFGENQTGGEWPYEDLQLDYDTTHLANDITITQNYTSQNFYAINSVSQLAYFDRTMTRTVNVNSIQECQAAAYFLAWRYGQPLSRVSSITINPAALAGMWPVALTLDVGMCIQVNRRPPGCPEISLLLWVENKQWTISETGAAKLVLQCSPVIPTDMGQFTTWRTTVKSSAASGQAVITVAPPTQDTVNPLNAYIYPGMSLTLDKGTALAETLTVLSVQATGSSWTSGTITFTSNLAHAHGAGAFVNEPYSSGQTSAGQFDANSQFDDTAFSY